MAVQTLVNPSTLGSCPEVKMLRDLAALDMRDVEHEAAVAAFFRDAAERDPEAFVEACESNPVTTRYGFRAISEREVSLEAMVARYGENAFGAVGPDSHRAGRYAETGGAQEGRH